jgi:hypothetical protein
MRTTLSRLIPLASVPEPFSSAAQGIEVEDFQVLPLDDGIEITFSVAPSSEPLEIPFGDENGLALILEELATISIRVTDDFRVGVGLNRFLVRLPSFLRPATLVDGQWIKDSDSFQEIEIASSDGLLNAYWGIDAGFGFDWPTDSSGNPISPSVSVGPTMIADTGIVFSASNVELRYEPDGFVVTASEATIHLSEDFPTSPNLIFENVRIDSQGFTGTAEVDWGDLTFDPATGSFTGQAAGELFGLQGGLEHFGLEFRENLIIASDISGALVVPYFNEPVEIQLTLDQRGNFSITLAGADSDIQLTKEELLQLSLKSLQVQKVGELGSVKISGGLEPLLMSSDGLQWPRLDVTDLYIDSAGKFSIQEAWLDLKDLATLDLWGFHFELRRIGIGSEDASDQLWVDLSGGLRLIEQIPVALDVEGFRLAWPRTLLDGVIGSPSLDEIQTAVSQIEVQFDGIYLFFGVPDAVEFEGLIRFFKDAQIVGFAGDMALRVPASGFGAEAGLLIGLSFAPPFPFLYVYFGVDLPAGIPLGQSGLALKGAQGMFGLNVAPDKTPEQNWYYDWYKRGPIVGAHPTNKWKPAKDALALGVGVTITTADGYVKGTRGLIVLAIPGPILIIEGRALILSGLQPNAEPPLRALAVFDGGAGTVQFNVEAEATLIADLVKAYGMLEAFFDFNDLTNWHLYLGQDTPRDRRIRADILKLDNRFLFKADAYLMIDMVGAETLRSRIGVSIGFEPNVPKIDPLEVDFAATIGGDGLVTARPEQFSGDADLEAHLRLSALGVSIRLSADARFLTEGPKPLKVGAHVHVEADMPDPLEPVEATIEFEWEAPRTPVVEPPLSEIAVNSKFDPAGAGFRSDSLEPAHLIHDFETIDGQWETPAKISPVVPVDSQPIVGFKQKMNSTIRSFARHPDGRAHHYDVGLFRFSPFVTTIKLFEHEKKEDDVWHGDERDWTLIASTVDADHKPLPGVWLAESDPDSPEVPSPRRVQFWSDNPLSSSARALGSGYKQFRGAIPAGRSLAERLLDDYPELMQCNYTKAESTCVDFNRVENVVIDPGDSFEYGDLLFKATERTVRIVDDAAAPLAYPSGGLIATIGELIRRSTFWLSRRVTRKCLWVDGYVDIHFRQRVRRVRIVLCQPPKFSDTEIGVRVRARRGRRSINELGPGVKEITLNGVRSCSVEVPADFNFSEEEWVIEADEGFDCLHIVRLGEFAIREVCYTTEEELVRSRLAMTQCSDNGVMPTNGETLKPGAYYRLDVKTEVDGELMTDDLPFSENSAIGSMLITAYNELLERLNDRGQFPRTYHQTCFFQTEGPPQNLRPYIKWTSPAHQSERFFCGDNISVRFLRSHLEEMFQTPFNLTARIKDTGGKSVDGFATRWERAGSATLFVEESVWEAHRSDLDWPDRSLLNDNLFVVTRQVGAGLLPGARYQLELVVPPNDFDEDESVLFTSSFITSQFRSFVELARSFQRPRSTAVKPDYVSNTAAIGEMQSSNRLLARSRWDWEHAEVDFRFETLVRGREGLEQVRLSRRERSAAHDAKFLSLAGRLADLYFEPIANELELYLIRATGSSAVICLWLRSPETLDVRLPVFEDPDALESPLIDHVGRTEIKLLNASLAERPITVLPNSDSTQVLIFAQNVRPWRSGKFSLQLTYHRDYGDETRDHDHRYDRPVERAGDGSGPQQHSLKWEV